MKLKNKLWRIKINICLRRMKNKIKKRRRKTNRKKLWINSICPASIKSLIWGKGSTLMLIKLKESKKLQMPKNIQHSEHLRTTSTTNSWRLRAVNVSISLIISISRTLQVDNRQAGCTKAQLPIDNFPKDYQLISLNQALILQTIILRTHSLLCSAIETLRPATCSMKIVWSILQIFVVRMSSKQMPQIVHFHF